VCRRFEAGRSYVALERKIAALRQANRVGWPHCRKTIVIPTAQRDQIRGVIGEHGASVCEIADLLYRQHEHVVSVRDHRPANELVSDGERDGAAASVEKRLLQPYALAIDDGALSAGEKECDIAGSQRRATGETSEQTPGLGTPGCCLPRDRRLGRLAFHRGVSLEQIDHRTRIFLEARLREHQLGRRPESPLSQKS